MHLGRRPVLGPCLAALAALVLPAGFASAQTAAAPATPANPTPPVNETQAANANTNGQETITLSPYEVQENAQGYYAPNTMSATRFNSKLEDIGSSITVVTKQQMEDFSMLDINDIFLYAGNTQGTGTYTDYTINRNGDFQENVSNNPTGANRVRGISAANISFANFETTGRIPIDPIVADAVEIFRGPNATVFGLGNPGGTVNTDPAMPLLTRELTQVQSRGDSYGGYRESLDVSRVLLQDKLAIRGSAVFQHDGFIRKPAGVNTVRYNGMIKYKPFPKTTIEAAVYWYRMDGTRPNYAMPRDYISYWQQSGKPTWDPVTQTIHVGGQTLGPYSSTTYSGPDYFENSFTGSAHSYVFVGPNGQFYWTAPTTFSNLVGPTSGGQADMYMSTSPAAGANLGKITNQPLFSTTPSVSSKAIYDWTKYNLQAANYDMDNALTTYATIDQNIMATPFNTLNAQVAFFKEDTNRYQRNVLGTTNDNGQSGQLFIDVNERNLDGTPNPFFLRPYLGTDQPRTTLQPWNWTTYRVQGEDTLDFTALKPGWLKWFGTHELSGYDEYKYRIQRQYSFKDSFTNALPWYPAGLSRANQGNVTNGPAAGLNITKNYFRYYVGNANGTGQVQYAPSTFQYGNYPYTWGAMGGPFHTETDTLGQVAVTDATGLGNNTKTILKTRGALLQSHWLDDMLVTTFGIREDFDYVMFGQTPQLNSDGMTFNYQAVNSWAGTWRLSSGRTTQRDAVLRPFKDISWFNADTGGYVGEIFRTMGFYIDKSDSFIPQAPAQDILGNPLSNQTGTGKEWGMEFTALNSRLHVKINRYIDKSINNRQGDASTLSQRVVRHDIQGSLGSDVFALATQATNWVTAANPSWTTAQVQAEVAKEIGLTSAQQNELNSPNPPLAATQDIVSSGTELEAYFNPTQYWTLGANASRSHVINENVSSGLQTWINERMPIWTTIVDTRTNTLWWNTNYGGKQTPAQNFATFVQAPYDLIRQQDGKSNPQNPEWMFRGFTNLRLKQFFESGVLSRIDVTGAARWQSRSAIGYYGLQQLPAVITDLNANAPVWGDKWNWQFDLGAGYSTTLFTDRIRTKFQIICRNLTENGHLAPIGAYPDGTPNAYRIVDPRQWIATIRFDL